MKGNFMLKTALKVGESFETRVSDAMRVHIRSINDGFG